LEFIAPENNDFFNYWKNLPREGLLPNSKSFLPEDIPQMLPFITIYELVSRDFIKFKLAGTSIDQRDGAGRTGDNYLDQVAPQRRQKAADAFWAFYNQPCAMRVLLELHVSTERKFLVEGLGLPMLSDTSSHPIVYYSNYEVEDASHSFNLNDQKLELITVRQRDFIDIGAGVPDFKD